MAKNNHFTVAVYLRLSQDDECDSMLKSESNSIKNQRMQIMEFIQQHEELEFYKEYVDDGYTGINFERPAFKEMIGEVISGNVNCIVVKDLSRFGRDYIESGRYLQKMFPSLDVRFIAINDHYDSFSASETEKNLVIPFKNFINDNYCRDISTKVRSVCAAKRRQGQYMGNYLPYGYRKSQEDKHKIIIDEDAKPIVQKIYAMKIAGYSSKSIANHLNELGVLSPMEYKKSKGIKYQTGFPTGHQARWDTPSINRILTNEIYIGVMQQGKRQKINYKLDKIVTKAKSDWIEHTDNHEPIIEKDDFEAVQRLLKCDIKAEKLGSTADLFAGLLFCGDCKEQMVKKVDKRGKTEKIYYICSKYNKGKGCSRHSIKQDDLKEIVQTLLNEHMTLMKSYESIIEQASEMEISYENFKKLDQRQEQTKRNKAKFEMLKQSLYQDLKEKVINENEFYEMREFFSNQIVEADLMIQRQECEIHRLYSKSIGNKDFFLDLKKHKKIQVLDRCLLVKFVNKILIYDDNRIEIKFNYEDTILVLEKLKSRQSFYPLEVV